MFARRDMSTNAPTLIPALELTTPSDDYRVADAKVRLNPSAYPTGSA